VPEIQNFTTVRKHGSSFHIHSASSHDDDYVCAPSKTPTTFFELVSLKLTSTLPSPVFPKSVKHPT
jgi:hypothetical protein